MGKRKSSKIIRCKYFTWKLFRRGTIYYADGRGNATNLGKHSLNAKTEEDALKNLQRLDEKMARETSLIPNETVVPTSVETKEPLSIPEGWKRFLEYCDRPVVMGGVSRNTLKRYRAVRDWHITFCSQQKIEEWSRFDCPKAEEFGRWRHANGEMPRTLYLEMTLVVSIVKWLVDPAVPRFEVPDSCPSHQADGNRHVLLYSSADDPDAGVLSNVRVRAVDPSDPHLPGDHWNADWRTDHPALERHRFRFDVHSNRRRMLQQT